MVVAHEGLASLVVDLHEVGDLIALTNSLVLKEICRRGNNKVIIYFLIL